ncbi:hypothetical protein MRY02_18980 [Clostridioides difficile]|nr:hypothetical protein [Clostridioides difficile]MCE4868654.1 hypothetical protein [Clostridioides difficile]MCI4829703.1 hypothetical protein [Clostridioides difficile]MCI4833381.1 hypothetical protein [Clostridioides difficile]MCI4833384.1 hypothetical protein [Clostridioides difficile]
MQGGQQYLILDRM